MFPSDEDRFGVAWIAVVEGLDRGDDARGVVSVAIVVDG